MKTAITCLQEYAVHHQIAFPDYTITSFGPTFTSYCNFNQLQTRCTSSSRIQAKTLSAEAMMIKLGAEANYHYLANCKVEPPMGTKTCYNAIGTLNEILMKMGKRPYAIYTEMIAVRNVMYVIQCSALNLTTEGVAATKRAAKHKSALAMLDALQLQTPSWFCLKLMPITSATDLRTRQKLLAPSQFVNFVGLLNEYKSPRGTNDHPVYTELGKENGYFVTQVEFLSMHAKACGITRKDAKQEAARKMIGLIGRQMGLVHAIDV